jgi:signal transduction histidine kinase/CheY-like chemotaxis protein
MINTALEQKSKNVLVSPITIRKDFIDTDPRLYLTLSMASKIIPGNASEPVGVVVLTIDVSGMEKSYRDTVWVKNDGKYLNPQAYPESNAFADFPGLEEHFKAGKLALWQGSKEDIIWVPLLSTEDNQPLWVGRRVDPSPISEIRWAISWRVLSIMFILALIILFLARRFAHQVEKLDTELIKNITDILEQDKAVDIKWGGPHEIQELANKLNELSKIHVKNTGKLKAHTRELEESNRYKSEFLANVSHELRTPLNSILLLSKLLSEDNAIDAQGKQKALVINTAGKDLKSMIDNILDLSRIESGKTTFSLQNIHVVELLEELTMLVKPQFDEKTLKLELSVAQSVPEFIYNDAEKIRQILKNFLSNAAKFTDSGTVSINVATDVGENIRISVIDSGIGIPPDKQSIIFDAFRQADGSISRQHGGTGLGLAISMQLAHLLGGDILLESEMGHGSSFSLILPVTFDASQVDGELIEHEDEPPEYEGTQDKIAEQSHEESATGQHILIVDDDIQTLLHLTPLMEAWGYRVSGAGDGEEALETLNSEPDIELVIMDVRMPVKDGYATIKEMKTIPELSEIPIITMSSEITKPEQTESAIDHIIKPIDPDILKTILTKHFGQQ